MSLIVNTFVNVWRFLRNVFASLLRRPPNFVWFDITGDLPEFEQRVGFVARRLGRGPSGPSLESVRERLRVLSSDGRVEGVVLRVRSLAAGWAACEELRNELLAYRERGGKVVAYLVEGGMAAYYLASAADEILATPLATINVTGVRTSATFLKDALDKVGVEAEVVAVTPYKSAFDRFTRNDFSDEAREQADRLLEGRYAEIVAAISAGRGLSSEDVKRKIDAAPYPAREAVSEGLLDGVCYEDELPERLGSERKAKLAEWGVARRAVKVPYRTGGGKRVGVVSLDGAIVRGKSRSLPVPLPLVGGRQAGDESVVAALRMAEKNGGVASVLFHVESGGGDALASDLIWREVERVRNKKPVVVLMGNVAASGGYYVGASADHIVVRKNTVTGSIGVISLRPVAEGLFENLGIGTDAVERGRRSGLLDPSRRPTPDEMRVLEGQIDAIYSEFKDRVTKGRGIEESKLADEIAGGRVWTGTEARELGLADEVGGFAEAMSKAKELGGVKRSGPGAFVKIHPPRKGRPSPGDPAEAARLAIEEVRALAKVLLETKVWLVSPYEFTDGW
jgi:protease IV